MFIDKDFKKYNYIVTNNKQKIYKERLAIYNMRRLKDKDYIHYNELVNRELHRKDLVRMGFKFINRTNKHKKILAYVFIGVGVVTLPLPTGSILLIGLGFSMLGLRKDYLKRYYKLYVYRRKAKRLNKL